MTPTARTPSAVIRLDDGTHLTLYRDVKFTLHKDNSPLIGDYLIALVPGMPRAVLYFSQKEGKQNVEMVYSKLHGQFVTDLLPEESEKDIQWSLCSIDNPADVTNFTKLYDLIKNHP